jgi:hypothetical protein
MSFLDCGPDTREAHGQGLYWRPVSFFPMIPAGHTLGIIGGKRERNGGRCFQKWNAILPNLPETECHFPKSTGTIRLGAVYCAFPIHYRNPSNILWILEPFSHSVIVTNEIWTVWSGELHGKARVEGGTMQLTNIAMLAEFHDTTQWVCEVASSN